MGLLGSLGSLNVLLSADTAQFSSAMDKAAYSAERNLKKIGITANLSLAALAAAFVANTKNALTFADSMGDMAERLGMTSKQVSILAYAAKMSDVEIGTLEATIKKMNIAAYKGSDVFKNLGVAVKDSSGSFRNGYEIFNDVVEALRKMPDGVGKANAAVEAFGKTGQDIVPLFKEGAKSLTDFGKEAKSLGVIIEEESAKNADRFDKFIKKAVEASKGFGVKTVDAIASVIDGFKLVRMSSEEYQKTVEGYKKKSDEAYVADKKRKEGLAEQALAYEKVAENVERLKKMQDDGAKLTESMRTAQEKYNDELGFYNTLLQGGAISQETFQRAVKKSSDALLESTRKTNDLKDVGRDLGFTFQSAFEDAIIEGKKFNEVLVSLAKDIERIILRQLITQPLANAIAGGITGMFNTGPSAPMSPAGVEAYVASKRGNVFSGGNVVPFAAGGIIGGPVMWPMAGGKAGLAGEAGKEAILPLTRTRTGDLGVSTSGANRTIVNVYAPPGSDVKQDSQQEGGLEKINIYIDKAVAGNIGRAGSDTHRAMKNTFGLGQVLTKR